MVRILMVCGLIIMIPFLAAAQESPKLVLFPVTPGMDAGGWGRTWSTHLVLTNRGTDGAELIEYGIFGAGLSVGPGRTLVDPFPTRVHLWRLWGVDEDALDFRLLVRNSQSPHPGVVIPVLTTKELERGVLGLTGIPLIADARTMLRIYAIGARDVERPLITPLEPMNLTVRIFKLPGGLFPPPLDELVAEVDFTVPPNQDGVRLVTISSLDDLLPDGVELVRVEIRADDEDARLWGFASVTRNTADAIPTVIVPE